MTNIKPYSTWLDSEKKKKKEKYVIISVVKRKFIIF